MWPPEFPSDACVRPKAITQRPESILPVDSTLTIGGIYSSTSSSVVQERGSTAQTAPTRPPLPCYPHRHVAANRLAASLATSLLPIPRPDHLGPILRHTIPLRTTPLAQFTSTRRSRGSLRLAQAKHIRRRIDRRAQAGWIGTAIGPIHTQNTQRRSAQTYATTLAGGKRCRRGGRRRRSEEKEAERFAGRQRGQAGWLWRWRRWGRRWIGRQ